MPILPTMSKEIAALRRKTGLNLTDFASLAGVSVSAVSRWEGGHRAPGRFTLDAIRRIVADFLKKKAA